MRIVYVLGFLPTYVSRELEILARSENHISVLLPGVDTGSKTATLWNSISGKSQEPGLSFLESMRYDLFTCKLTELFFPLLKSIRHPLLFIRALLEGEIRYFAAASMAVRSIRKLEKPDLIHAHFAGDAAHIARFMSSITRTPFSVTTHATDIFAPKSKTRLNRILQSAAHVFTISGYNESLLEELGVRKDKLSVYRLAIDITKLPPREAASDPPLLVCTASGLVQKKGVPVLLQAVKILNDMGISIKVKVVGSDPDGIRLAMFQDQSRNLPIEFVGIQTSEDTLKLLAGATVFVLPCIEADNGDKDGIPVSLMEAMGMGIPCISTGISGIPELIENGASGLLVSPGSAEELSEAIENLLSDFKMSGMLGMNGQQRIRQLHSPAMLKSTLISIFQKIASR